MRTAAILAVLLLGAAPARAAGLPEFEARLAELRLSLLASAEAAKARRPPVRQGPERVTDPETWARMLAAARQRPTSVQDLRAGNSDFRVFAAVSTAAVAGQECAEGFQPRNALYVCEVLSGRPGAVYPARLVSDCVGPARTVPLLAVDADAEGFIQDSAFYDPGQGKALLPGRDRLSPAQVERFYALLAGLVRLFSGREPESLGPALRGEGPWL
ncbi:MAG: hypothetical protein PHU21_02720 [Elusimicrobia bacterium]|nr:hypothetical protein [Elusimicrobiota bacterium]